MTGWGVVGCSECQTPWLLEGAQRSNQETIECPNCGQRHATSELRALAHHDEKAGAAELRSRILAARAGETERYDAMDDYGVLADQVDRQIEAAVTDAESVASVSLTSRSNW